MKIRARHGRKITITVAGALALPGFSHHLAIQPDAQPAATAGDTEAVSVWIAKAHLSRPQLASAAHLLSTTRLYRVHAGQSLSGIAASLCRNPQMWTGIYEASRARHLTARNANQLSIGQQLAIWCSYQPSQLRYAWTADPPHASPRYRTVAVWQGSSVSQRNGTDRWDGQHHACGDGDHDGFDMPCQYLGGGGGGYAATAARSGARSYRAYAQPAATYHGSSGCQSHIIADESGGNARAVNPSSGAGGLYQFLPSTWHALGHSGLPQYASVAEQNQAYYQQVSISGYSAWAASGGCG
jgi:hypothetical protein